MDTNVSRRALLAGAAAATVVILGSCAWLVVAPRVEPAAATPARPDIDGRLGEFDVYYRDLVADHARLVHRFAVPYRAWDGRRRRAYVVVPRWYSPARNPRLPLVISPHGRGLSGLVNLRFWGGLPAFGPFAVVSPEGQGRVLTRYSWGWRGQIDDLARMPAILARRFPWLRIDRRRIYAVGSSMGGQETLLLVARFPQLLAGAAALDADTNLAVRYRAFSRLHRGTHLQELARLEIGGTPGPDPRTYAVRSPIHWAASIARSGVPLHIWWSYRDRIVRDQREQSGLLFRTIRRLHPRAPVTEYVGKWRHSTEYHASARLPLALVELGLIRLSERVPTPDRIRRASPAAR